MWETGPFSCIQSRDFLHHVTFTSSSAVASRRRRMPRLHRLCSNRLVGDVRLSIYVSEETDSANFALLMSARLRWLRG